MKEMMMHFGIETVRQAAMALAVMLALVLLLTGCSDVVQLFGQGGKQPAKTPEVVEFTYSVSGMSAGYTVTFASAENGGTHVMAEINYGSNSMDVVLDEDYMTWLSGLVRDYRMDKWDGFDKVDKHVLDGESFALHITLADGEEILANGSNAYPKNFYEPMGQVEALIDELIRAHSDLYPKQIESDEMTYFCAEFREDPYTTSEFKVNCRAAEDAEQLEVRIRNREDLIEGEYVFSGTCEEFPFEEVQKLICKHDIPAWNGWNAVGEGEAFVVRSMYASGERVEAYGTEHPDGYDAFRDDITALLMEYITENMGTFTENK